MSDNDHRGMNWPEAVQNIAYLLFVTFLIWMVWGR